MWATEYSVAQDLYSLSPVSFSTRDYDELATVPYKDGLVFCSNRPHNVFIIWTNAEGLPLLDLYFVRKKGNQKWSSPVLLSKELNSKYNEGPMTFSKDGKTIYFTKGEVETENIFTSTFNGAVWEAVTPFPYNEQRGMTAQPFLSDDGKKFFFASDRRGGYGGFDLYVCTLNKNNQWSRPKNLGIEINSANDEKYPFLHANGRLYFASNRKGGYGGFDIYYTKQINGKWIKPVLLPPPINTPNEEFAFTSDSIDRHGYLSSDRNSRDKLLDIFEFTMNYPLLDTLNCKPQKINKYRYEFTEQSAFATDTTTFLYEWDFGDGQKIRGKELQVEHSFKNPGDYLVQLNVIDTLTGQVYLNQAANIFPVRDIEQPYISCPDTAQINKEIIFDASKTYLPDRYIIGYYWDFNDGHISVGKEVKHIFTEPGVYKIILGVTYLDQYKRNQTEIRFKPIVIEKR